MLFRSQIRAGSAGALHRSSKLLALPNRAQPTIFARARPAAKQSCRGAVERFVGKFIIEFRRLCFAWLVHFIHESPLALMALDRRATTRSLGERSTPSSANTPTSPAISSLDALARSCDRTISSGGKGAVGGFPNDSGPKCSPGEAPRRRPRREVRRAGSWLDAPPSRSARIAIGAGGLRHPVERLIGKIIVARIRRFPLLAVHWTRLPLLSVARSILSVTAVDALNAATRAKGAIEARSSPGFSEEFVVELRRIFTNGYTQ